MYMYMIFLLNKLRTGAQNFFQHEHFSFGVAASFFC